MSVNFVRKDDIDKFIPITIKIADHFSVKRSYIRTFCKMVRNTSRLNVINMSSQLNVIQSTFSSFVDGGSELCQILLDAFGECQDKSDLDKLRGSLAEGLLLGRYGNDILQSKTFGWGAQVHVQNKKGPNVLKVKYNCPHHNNIEYPDCVSRSTVDLGLWDGEYGEFFECKVKPDNIGCPEMSYMKVLNKELTKKGIKHTLYFVSTDTREAMKMKIEKKHPKENFYEVLSLQETNS
ncbi:hypothetical protein [Bacillus velezensis]|uniref:hypothetical protein n=1 Tax=Bacillus velezensis TaxID=492670 RepID=UPI000E25A43B|nr:hypothetical protein [Bacillus velezensis]QHQ58385.1 hypothetical protein GWK37_15335 [Bacillus velezensis]RDY86252.1 hypothetical protein C3734_10435 [Bacillus velezensis]